MSKVAQPLHYQSEDALVAFGLGYATMAIAGGLSFLWGALADRWGGLPTVRLGTFLYAIGIAGRIWTDLVPSIAFSALAGAGASLALVGIRPWVRSQLDDDDLSRVVAGRTLGNQTGVVVGTLGAACLFAIAPAGDGPVVALVAAPTLVVLAGLWLLFGARSDSAEDSRRADASPSTLRTGWLAVRLAAIGVLSGFAVSLITPYLPVLLTSGGLPEAVAALAIAGMSVAQIVTSGILGRRSAGPRPFRVFALAEAATGLTTVLIGIAVGAGPVVIVVLLMARAVFVAISAVTEETIQYAVIPGSAAGFVFGVSQTAFLIGDAVGGAVGGPLWAALGAIPMTLLAGMAAIANAGLLPVLLARRTPVAMRRPVARS